MKLKRTAALTLLSSYVLVVPLTAVLAKGLPPKPKPVTAISGQVTSTPIQELKVDKPTLMATLQPVPPTSADSSGQKPTTQGPHAEITSATASVQGAAFEVQSKKVAPTSPKSTARQANSTPKTVTVPNNKAGTTNSAVESSKQKATSPVVSASVASNVIGNSPIIGPYTQEDLYWLAKMITAEADAEPYDGKVAVGAVILHRVASPNYPNNIKDVDFQVIDGHYQFSSVLNDWIYKVEPNDVAYRAAKDALAGSDPSQGAMLYYNPVTSTNKWILSRPVTVVIGNHTFAK